MVDLLSLAKAACEAAMREGVDQAEAYVQESKRIDVDVEKSMIKSCNVVRDQGLSVRAFKDGGRGFAYTMKLTLEEAVETARRAASLAKVAHKDPDFKTLPTPRTAPRVPGLFDPRLAELSADQAVEWAVQGIETAKAAAKASVVQGGAGFSVDQAALVNSLGVAVEESATSVGLSIFSIVKQGDDVGSYSEFDSARRLDDFDPGPVGGRASEQALRFLGARKVATGNMPVIFGPLAANGLLYALCGAANAESVQRNRSFLAGWRGRQVASELVTIVDDGLYPAGLSSSSYDGEGVPRGETVIVDRGVLKTYLHNSYTANKAGELNTGHAARGGYRGGVGIGPTNLRPRLGDWTSEEIIRETREGLYVTMAGLSPNQATGDISGSVDFGFKIEHGEIAYPVKNAMIGVNILDLFKGIDAVSKDYREEPGLVMPTIRAQNVRVAGGA
ncbi:MAG: TldD/PmbA family protein [Candidatus Bathyarchaeia archaeon]